MSVFRLSVDDAAVTVQTWPDWASFDAAPPSAQGLWCDIAYAVQPPGPEARDGGGIVELQRMRVQNGRLNEAANLLRQDGDVWREAGAAVLGSFKVVHGDDLPACLLLMRWPSLEAALDGQLLVERHGGWIAARRAIREEQGIAAVRAARRIFRPSLVLRSGPPA